MENNAFKEYSLSSPSALDSVKMSLAEEFDEQVSNKIHVPNGIVHK